MPEPTPAEPCSVSNAPALNLDHSLGPIIPRAPGELKTYAQNPRKHSQKQLVKLMSSIREFGFTLPVLIDADDVIIAGEARVTAARTLDLPTIPTIVAQGWSDAKVRAYRLADNRLAQLANWDEQALALELSAIIELDEIPIEILGWETGEIDLLLEFDDTSPGKDSADDPIPVSAVAVSEPGDLWLLGEHRLLCASSLAPESWKRLMNGAVAAMVFTDPPYNVPVSGHICGLGKVQHAEFAMASGEMSKDQFTAFLTKALARLTPHLRDGAILDVCMDFRHMGELLDACNANDLGLLNLCVWNKNNGGMGSLYRSKHVLVFIVKKGSASHINNAELGRHGRYRTNVWDYAGVNTFGKGRMKDLADHPTVKPTALVADAIRDVTHPGDIVLDAFMGSGTTILAAERTRRVAFGTEISPQYVDVAIRRWETLTGGRAILDGTDETFQQVSARRQKQRDPSGGAIGPSVPSGMVAA